MQLSSASKIHIILIVLSVVNLSNFKNLSRARGLKIRPNFMVSEFRVK